MDPLVTSVAAAVPSIPAAITHAWGAPVRRVTLHGMKTLRTAALVALGMITAQHAQAQMNPHGGVPMTAERAPGPVQSEQGAFLVEFLLPERLRTGPLFRAELKLTDEHGEPVDSAHIEVDGGMPEHGHGLPTSPRVTRQLGAGHYLVEGLRLSMRGRWVFSFAIVSPDRRDRVHFEVMH